MVSWRVVLASTVFVGLGTDLAVSAAPTTGKENPPLTAEKQPAESGRKNVREPARRRSDPPVIRSSWDDLLDGVTTRASWEKRRALLHKRYLDLLRDDQKPKKPPLALKVHETKVVANLYSPDVS